MAELATMSRRARQENSIKKKVAVSRRGGFDLLAAHDCPCSRLTVWQG